MTAALFYLAVVVETCQSQGREKNYGHDGQKCVRRSTKGLLLRRLFRRIRLPLVCLCTHDLSTLRGLSVLKRDPGHYSSPCSTQNSKTQSLKGRFFTMGKLSPQVLIGCSPRGVVRVGGYFQLCPARPRPLSGRGPWRGIGGKT